MNPALTRRDVPLGSTRQCCCSTRCCTSDDCCDNSVERVVCRSECPTKVSELESWRRGIESVEQAGETGRGAAFVTTIP